jgi:hypothetical protein
MDMKGWEVTVVRRLIREVKGVPGFVARMVDKLLSEMENVGQGGARNVTEVVQLLTVLCFLPSRL